MKSLSRYIILGLSTAIFFLPSQLYGAVIRVRAMTSAIQDSKKVKDDLYATFKKGIAGDPNARKAAYDAGKEYLQKFPDEKDPHVKEIKDWIAGYEANTRPLEVLVNVYKEKKYAEAFQIGKQVLITDPDNIRILTALGYAGMQAAAGGNIEFVADAIIDAKKAIQLIGSGKTPADWKPFAGKEETLGWLNYSVGVMVLRTAPNDAITYLKMAAQYEGAPKKNPVIYYYLAGLYSQAFEKERTEFKSQYEGKPETPASKAALQKVSAEVDLIIDAYARAIAYTDASPQLQQLYQQQEVEWTTKLTELYKSRHNDSDAGLKELIADIRTKPLPGGQTLLTPMTMP